MRKAAPERSLSTCLDKLKNNFNKNNLAALSQNWSSIVGEKLSTNCIPLSLNRGILIIGASHPQWRQALIFTKIKILEVLNSAGHKIKDIKIQQYYPEGRKKIASEKIIWDNHPSRIDVHGIKICKYCQKPASVGEITRWNKCSFCRRNDLAI
tara:strand:- start:91 stop:549 length:459 start_codon:yes stop_codon:yes gene_type:complete